MKKETVVISLGGSLVVPDRIDIGFLDGFRDLIMKHAARKKFIICVGGGKTARIYQQAMEKYGANNSTKDWAGIKASRLNAEVVKTLFGRMCHPKIIINPARKIKTEKNIAISAGWRPGRSTDYISVLLAKNSGAKIIINLTNVDYIYDKNPSEFPDAQPLKDISWQDFRKIVGNKWSPGLSSPFDPVASRIAQKLKLKVTIINGKKLERLSQFLDNKPFIGTIIK